MGCGGSKERGGVSPVNGNYDRRPKISVRIQSMVKKPDEGPGVIFIFGGPGSRKGRIVDDLCNSYGFKFISGEDLVLADLPKKVHDKVNTVMDIKELLEDDPSYVSMDSLLGLVSAEIEDQGEDDNTIYLVDIMPNLKYMLKGPTMDKNFAGAMEKFEQQHPVSFALSLSIPADKVLRAKQSCAKTATSEKMKETGGQGDEADSGRTQKRATMYEQSVKAFMEYFTEHERLVTVDVTCGVADLIWHQVHRLLCQLDFHPHRTVNTVILFAFNESEASAIDYEKYLMEKVYLRDLVVNPNDTVENLLKALSKYIDNKCTTTDSFVVILEGTNITRDKVQQITKKPIVFVEVFEGYLETYLPGSPKNFIPKMGSTKYKAVCSLENEYCLFPANTQTAVCSKIAAMMVNLRTL